MVKTPHSGERFGSVQFSHSVVSDSFQPHESQHARPPCPSPTPGVHSNSRPSSRWCHPTISSSVVPFSSCPQSLPASESFPMSQFFTWGGQSTGVLALASVLPKNKPRQHIKKQRHHFANKGPSSQSFGFSRGHVWMWELDYKESWVPKNWCFWTVVLEKTLRVPWTARRSNQSILKEISPEYSLEGLRLKLKL